MNDYFSNFSRPLARSKRFFTFLALLCACVFLFPFSACSKRKEIDYFDSVSECRSNILLAQTQDFSLRVYAVAKEYPYAADGIPNDITTRAEFYLSAPSGDKECTLSFTVDQKAYGGDISYDSVKAEYYYSCSVDISTAKELPCVIVYGNQEVSLTAVSVDDEHTYTPQKALQTLVDAENSLFDEWTDEYGFIGEIYLRLIYEDAPYYYIGLIDRNGKIVAFLMNAQTGKVLAKREQ